MNKIALIFIILSFSTRLQAQQLLTKDQQEVQKTVINFFEAFSKRDSISLKVHCTPDVTLYEYGKIWTIDTLITNVIKKNTAADFKRTNTFDFISTTTDKNTAWVTYRLRSTITKDGTQTTLLWLETVALTKEKKRWKVRHLHSTLLKRS
jgi:ketosteroid isomerase-like protein